MEQTDTQGGQTAPVSSAPTILIDNNCLQHFLSKKIGTAVAPLLSQLEELNATLAVSEIVIYEALKAIVFKPDKVQPVADFIDSKLTRYPVNDDVLIHAARIHEMYGSKPKVMQFRDKISSEDIIIATTAIQQGAYILTSDCNDFPRPFFKEVDKGIYFYRENNRQRHIIIYLLQPDNDVIEASLKSLS